MIPPRTPLDRMIEAVFGKRFGEDPLSEEQKIEMTRGRRHREDALSSCEYPTRPVESAERRCIRPTHYIYGDDDGE